VVAWSGRGSDAGYLNIYMKISQQVSTAAIVAAMASLCLAAPSRAASGVWGGGGSQFEIGARAAGMGGAYITGGDDASIVFYNPATLGVWNSLRLTGGYGYLSKKGFAGFGSLVLGDELPIVGGKVGFGYHVVGFENVPTNTTAARAASDWSIRQCVISYGRQLHPKLSAGGTVRHVKHTSLSGEESNLEAGLAILYAGDHWSCAVVGRDLLVPDLDLEGTGHALRASAVIGGGYTTDWLNPGMKLGGAADYEALKDAADRVHLGVEMRMMVRGNLSFALRTGYIVGPSQRGRPSVGAGLRWTVFDVGSIDVDWAYFRNEDSPHIDKGGHTVSVSVEPQRILGWAFGKRHTRDTVVVTRVPVIDAAQIVQDAFDALFDSTYDRMSRHFLGGDYDSAIVAAYQLQPLATTPPRHHKATDVLEAIRQVRDEETASEPSEPVVEPDPASIGLRSEYGSLKQRFELLNDKYVVLNRAHSLCEPNHVAELDSLRLAMNSVIDSLKADSIDTDSVLFFHSVREIRKCIGQRRYRIASWLFRDLDSLSYAHADSIRVLDEVLQLLGCISTTAAANHLMEQHNHLSAYNWWKIACDVCRDVHDSLTASDGLRQVEELLRGR